MDLRNKEQAEAIFAELDRCGVAAEVLCLNAADLALGPDPAAGTPFFEVTPEYVEYILQSNVVGNFRMVQEAARRMCEIKKGSIVFISSNSAVRPNANRVPYIASKGGINAMSKALAVDLGKYGIRSNVIMPGTIKTMRWVSMGEKREKLCLSPVLFIIIPVFRNLPYKIPICAIIGFSKINATISKKSPLSVDKSDFFHAKDYLNGAELR